MAEPVDAADSKSADRKVMGVRFSLWAWARTQLFREHARQRAVAACHDGV